MLSRLQHWFTFSKSNHFSLADRLKSYSNVKHWIILVFLFYLLSLGFYGYQTVSNSVSTQQQAG